MKKHLLSLFLLIFSLLVGVEIKAQNVSLKTFIVKANYKVQPEIKLDEAIKTYSINLLINERKAKYLGFTKDEIIDSIFLVGYEKLDSLGDLRINVIINMPSYDPPKLQSKKRKKESGKKWTQYQYVYQIQQTANAKLMKNSGEVIKEFVSPYRSYYYSPKFKKLSKLEEFHKQKLSKVMKVELRQSLINSIRDVNGRMNSLIGSKNETKGLEFYSIKNKRHPEFSNCQKIINVVKSAFDNMVFESPIDSFITKIEPAIQYWKATESKYNSYNESDNRIRFMCRYNLALAYTWTRNYIVAKEYIMLIINEGGNVGRSIQLLKEIEEKEIK